MLWGCICTVSSTPCLRGVQVQDLEKARIFYTEGLGLAMDPGANFRQRGSVFVNFFNCGR